jgi:hypothetical protein
MTDRKIRNARTDRYTPKIEQKKKAAFDKTKKESVAEEKKKSRW